MKQEVAVDSNLFLPDLDETLRMGVIDRGDYQYGVRCYVTSPDWVFKAADPIRTFINKYGFIIMRKIRAHTMGHVIYNPTQYAL